MIGAGVGHKRSHYYPESKEERHDRKAVSMQDTIDRAVTKAITAILPTMYESFGSWIEGGKKEPRPVPSLPDSIIASNNSINVPPANPNPDRYEQTLPANPNPDRYVHGTADRSIPSISCTPGAVPGPSPLDELNALTVI